MDQWTGFDVVTDTYDQVHPLTSGFVKMANRFFPVVAQALNAGTPGVALTVTKAGTGSGTVTSSPAGHQLRHHLQRELHERRLGDADCRCGQRLDLRGLERRLHAAPSTCTVSMTQARAVTATFNGSGGTFALSRDPRGRRHGHRHLEPRRHQLRQHLLG